MLSSEIHSPTHYSITRTAELQQIRVEEKIRKSRCMKCTKYGDGALDSRVSLLNFKLIICISFAGSCTRLSASMVGFTINKANTRNLCRRVL